MYYVKHFNINDVDTKQVACIELHGKPNAATEGCVGVLGIDMDSPLHDVYKCVAVNGSIYSWELLSSGMSIISATITFDGAERVQFPYINLRTPAMYVVKMGDLIVDKEGYLYQINSLNSTCCEATYCDTQAFKGVPGEKGDPGPAYELTDGDKDSIAKAVKNSLTQQTWSFTLEDGSIVKKAIYLEDLSVTIEVVSSTTNVDPTMMFEHNGQMQSTVNTTFTANIGDIIAIYLSGYEGNTVTVNGVVIKETFSYELGAKYEFTVTSNTLIEHRRVDGHMYFTITEG